MYSPREPINLCDAPRPIESRPVVTIAEQPASLGSNRWSNLRLLSFGSYREYLSGDSWRSIRSLIKQRSGGVCEFGVCGASSVLVHHIDYSLETLRGERLDRLIDLCRDCHKICHQKRRASKKKRSRRKLSAKALARNSRWLTPAGRIKV